MTIFLWIAIPLSLIVTFLAGWTAGVLTARLAALQQEVDTLRGTSTALSVEQDDPDLWAAWLNDDGTLRRWINRSDDAD